MATKLEVREKQLAQEDLAAGLCRVQDKKWAAGGIAVVGRE